MRTGTSAVVIKALIVLGFVTLFLLAMQHQVVK